ncbi:MAG: glycosyltransferase 87 family protein [Patescibacteria group bacterium]
MQLRKFLAAKSDWLVLGILLAVFAALKIAVLAPHFADGWIYFYFGKLVAAGELPYRDFFYSSPPLIPYFMGFLHLLFGFKISLANFLPTIFSLADAILIFVLLRAKSVPVAWLAAGAYLFSFLNFATTDYFSEAHLLTTLVLLGLTFFERRKFFWAGIFFGLAGLTKLYGILPAVFLPILIFREPKNLGKFLAGILLAFGLPNLIFLGIIGREYLDLIFFNHLKKFPGIDKLSVFKFFIQKDFLLLLVLPLLAFTKNWRKILAPTLALGALVLFLIFFNDVYYLYLKSFLALLVLVLGFLAAQKFTDSPKSQIVALALIFVCTNISFAITNYLGSQSAKARIENPLAIVAEVQKSDRPLFGDFEIAPLVALLSGKNIFQNYVDTNSKWTDLGIFSPEKVAAEIHSAGGATVLTKSFVDQNIHGLEKLLPEKYFAENCQLEKTFPLANDYEDNAILVWSCS